MRKTVVTLSIMLGLVILGAAGGGWWLWGRYQSAQDDIAQLQADLRAAKSPDTSGGVLGVSNNGDVSPGGAQTSSNMRNMIVHDFGIQFAVPQDLTDLTYVESPPASGILNLTTTALQKKYAACGAAGTLGAMFRYPKGTPLPTSAAHAQKLTTAGSYDYYYLARAQDPCTDKAAIAAIDQIVPTIVASLRTIKEVP
jgi:hypothetical protein